MGIKTEEELKPSRGQALADTGRRYQIIKAIISDGFFPGKLSKIIEESKIFIDAILEKIRHEREEEDPEYKKQLDKQREKDRKVKKRKSGE